MTEKIRKKLEVPQKTSKEYVCTSCHFKTHNKYDFNRHWGLAIKLATKHYFNIYFNFRKRITNTT